MPVLIFFCLNLFKGTKCNSYQWCLKEYKDTETKACIIGVQTQVNKFNYIFGDKLAILLLRHSDNPSATLKSPKLFTSQAQSITQETFITLEELRDDDDFLLFFLKEVLTESKQLDIDELALGRKRKSKRITNAQSY